MRFSTLISSSKSVESLSFLAALLALTLFLLSNYPSSGIVRGDDDGSGIGGTSTAQFESSVSALAARFEELAESDAGLWVNRYFFRGSAEDRAPN